MKKNKLKLIIVFLVLLINHTSYSQSSVKVGKIEVMDFDSGIMSWDEANNKVKEKGNGWRLPNKEELFYLYKNKNLITGLSDKAFSYYWTSEKFAENKIWVLEISNGFETTDKKEVLNYVRLIKGKIQKFDEPTIETKQIIDEPKKNKIQSIPVIKIGSLEVALKDLGRMDWESAKYECNKLGEGWRLPNRSELNILYVNRSKIGGFKTTGPFPGTDYWTSETNNDLSSLAYVIVFANGYQGGSDSKSDFANVRAVKGIASKNLITNSIIGRPYRIGNLEIAQFDFADLMNWDDAYKACSNLGNGWRLPNRNEIEVLYNNLEKIDCMQINYWSSYTLDRSAWFQNFGYSSGMEKNGFQYKIRYNRVRAVRTIK